MSFWLCLQKLLNQTILTFSPPSSFFLLLCSLAGAIERSRKKEESVGALTCSKEKRNTGKQHIRKLRDRKLLNSFSVICATDTKREKKSKKKTECSADHLDNDELEGLKRQPQVFRFEHRALSFIRFVHFIFPILCFIKLLQQIAIIYRLTLHPSKPPSFLWFLVDSAYFSSFSNHCYFHSFFFILVTKVPYLLPPFLFSSSQL